MSRSYSTLKYALNAATGVARVSLARPAALNAMNAAFFDEMRACFRSIHADDGVRVVVLDAEGAHFSAGLDLKESASLFSSGSSMDGAARARLAAHIDELQASFNVVANCAVPVVAVVHGKAIGGAIDLLTACDVRVAAADAVLSVRETAIAIVADLGTLQRLPRVMNASAAREMAFTGGDYSADFCLRHGLLSHVEPTREAALDRALAIAGAIAANSPITVEGTKRVINHAVEHNVADGLEFVKHHNVAHLNSPDLVEAMTAFMQKRKPVFPNARL